MEGVKEIVGFPRYGVTAEGKIYSKKTRKFIDTSRVDLRGYPYVSLPINGKRVNKRLHRLVAIAFLPNPESKPQVNHKDGNKMNANLDNLENGVHQKKIHNTLLKWAY